MAQTFADLITRTITRLSMVPGYGVQTYAEDQIAEMLYHKFITARDMVWWDDMMQTLDFTVDQYGYADENIVRELPDVPVGDEVVINKYADIQYIWPTNSNTPLKARPRRANPRRRPLGTCRQLVAPNYDNVFEIVGASAGETFTIRWKTYYPFFGAADYVPFDDQALILGACWDYLEDDGSNPMQIEKFRNLYIQRMDQLVSAENDEELDIGAM